MKYIDIKPEMKSNCLDFSAKIIFGNNQYNRLPTTLDKRIERTFVGKLAELSFLYFLRANGINYPEGDMFQIFEGEKNVDGYDFLTNHDETIDIKCASKPFHKRIMVPIDQFENIPKDYYIGVKLDSVIENSTRLINVNSINKAIIYGYCTYNDLLDVESQNFGEGLCKAKRLDNLRNINFILEKF